MRALYRRIGDTPVLEKQSSEDNDPNSINYLDAQYESGTSANCLQVPQQQLVCERHRQVLFRRNKQIFSVVQIQTHQCWR